MFGAEPLTHPFPAVKWIRWRSAPLAREDRLRLLVGVLVLAGAYYGAAKLGYALEFSGPVAAIVWLPVGVGISFLYLGGLRFWPGVLVGDLLANDYGTLPLGSALTQTAGNVLEVVVATILIRRLVRRGSPLDNIQGVGLMLASLAAGAAISATIGVTASLLGDVIEFSAAPSTWRTWWLGDACGALILVPLAIAWHRAPRHLWLGRRWEAALMLAAVAGLSELALRTDKPLAYLVFPALIWAAVRFGQRGATLAIVLTAGFTVWETTHFVGPFVYSSITRSVLTTQLYLTVATLSTLCLAALVSERERFADRLRASRLRLLAAADDERRRLEHNIHDGAQQRLTALAVRLRLASEQAAREPGAAAVLFQRAEGDLLAAIDELRDLAHGIHPSALTNLGLAAAIRDAALRSSVPVVVVELPDRRLDATAEATAYYVLVEAVTNVQKYAQATSIRVCAKVSRRGLSVEVLDDGIGGAVESPDSGLRGLRDRVEAVGGEFEVGDVKGGGTRVAATIPATPVAA
jgi:signal transduction histidine kinase